MSEYTLYLGDCLEYMRTMEPGSVDAVITDPPYEANKVGWDNYFPRDWFYYAQKIARMTIVITDSCGLADSIPLVGNQFIDVISARNLNGMTRGPIGFNNWIAAVVSCAKPKKDNSWNFFEFAIREDMPEHPTPKPIEYMIRLIEKTTNPGDLIFDPFMGSGTTGVACMQLRRRFIGCEIDPNYYAIAEKRIKQAAAQMLLPLETAK